MNAPAYLYDNDHDYMARCPACGDSIDYCTGHGEIGDPAGRAILDAHDNGDHTGCHPDGCDDYRAPDTAAIARIRGEDGTLPAYTWPGGYQMLYITSSGDVICPACANNTEHPSDPPVDGDIYWEGPDETCTDCGAAIPSSYGDPDQD